MRNQHRTGRIALAGGCLLAIFGVLLGGSAATGQPACSRTVIFTTPAVTWRDIERIRPPTLLSLSRRGAIGSISVHTDVSRPSYASAFTTLGAGARIPDFDVSRLKLPVGLGPQLSSDIGVASAQQLHELSVRSGYGARPGALAGALRTSVIAIGSSRTQGGAGGFGDWPLLAAMDPTGHADYAASVGSASAPLGRGPVNLQTFTRATHEALALKCATVVLDGGYLGSAVQSQQATQRGLLNSDRLLAAVARQLDLRRDLLLVVTPTSPAQVTRLGVAIAVGAGFRSGSLLESASTRRPGIVTLPDVAPTVLAHVGVSQPSAMTGQPFFSAPAHGDRIAQAVALDRDAVFVDGTKPVMVWVFLAGQLVFFALALGLLLGSGAEGTALRKRLGTLVVPAGLVVAALPLATYLARLAPGADLGRGGFVALCLLLTAAVVGFVSMLNVEALVKLGLVAAASLALILGDLVTGGHLQLNSILGDSPLIAGRFAGAGNNAFAIMTSTTVLVATLLLWRRGRTRAMLLTVAALFVIVVVIDGAPQFGSDVGGVLALVPGFAIAWILLRGRRVSWKLVAAGLLAAIVVVGAFIAVDLSRPPQQRTHLGRFFEDVRSRGGSAFFETVRRKAASNLRQARYFKNLYEFLPAALVTALFLFWPLGWWRWWGTEQPVLRAGLIGALVVALLGSALNDSGISIFTTMLLFIAPMAIFVRLRFAQPAPAPEV